MASPLVQVPPGVQCFVGEEARRRRAIEDRVLAVFDGWGYEEIIPPLFDYADVFAGPSLQGKTYSFVGRDGRLLALRPDFTSLIAKIAAGRLADREPPVRVCYSGEVVRWEPPKAGRQSELHQIGLERLGGRADRGDAETLAVAAECLEALGVRDWVLALGHVGVFNGLVAGSGLEAAALDALRERVEAKDARGVRESLAGTGASAPVVEALAALAGLAGDRGVIAEARVALRAHEAALRPLEDLERTVRALEEAGLGERIAVDLGEVRGLDYYTGLVFRVYARGLGFEVGGGGRYDALLARFGRPLPAVGFMLGLDRVALLLERQAWPGPDPRPEALPAAGDSLGAALRSAREGRASGRRVTLQDPPA